MGLKLRLNLFHDVSAKDVYGAFARFYGGRGQRLLDKGDEFHEFALYERDGPWTLVNLDGGWEWVVRRQAQLLVSQALACRGFLVFVYDGDYWGYEFFKNGKVLDRFVQDEDPCTGVDWFAGESCAGNPNLIAQEFPNLSVADIFAYLVRDPVWAKYEETGDKVADDNAHRARWADHNRLNVPVRPSDEFRRFDECGVLDFLRFLGIRVELVDHRVTFHAPKFASFWLSAHSTPRAWHKK
jgi:hypothetical protein